MKKLSTFAIALLFGTGLFGAGSLRAEAAKDAHGEMTVSDRGVRWGLAEELARD